MDTKLPPTFWTDPEFDKCAPDVLLAVLWIKTNDRLNLLGFAEVSPRVFEFQTRLGFDVFERACQALGKGLVRDGNRYWLRVFVREQIGCGLALMNNNMRKPLARALPLISSPEIRAAILEEYPELSDANPKGLGRASDVDEALQRASRDGEALRRASGVPEAQEQRRAEQSREEQNRAEQRGGGVGEPKATPDPAAASRPADHPDAVAARMLALGEIMKRRADSVWSAAEKKALSAAGLLKLFPADFEEQVEVMKAFYRATIPDAKQHEFWRRSTLPILLNNWPSELDKARAWRRASGGEGDGVRKID